MINKYMVNLLNDTLYSKQEAFNGLVNVFSHPNSFILAWNFIQDNWNDVLKRYSKQSE